MKIINGRHIDSESKEYEIGRATEVVTIDINNNKDCLEPKYISIGIRATLQKRKISLGNIPRISRQ